MAQGADASEKFLSLVAVLPGTLQSFWPSLHPLDLLVGLCCGAGLRLAVYLKSKNAKKYRHGMEYGSARWGTREDIAPYVDEEKVASLILIGAQYKVPSLLIDFQNLIFRCMPNKAFESMGLSKSSTIKLAHSMRSLDFTSQLNNIRCPVTILCGKKDTANLKASKRLKELLPKATLHIVPNAGHELNKYAPNTIAEILNQ